VIVFSFEKAAKILFGDFPVYIVPPWSFVAVIGMKTTQSLPAHRCIGEFIATETKNPAIQASSLVIV